MSTHLDLDDKLIEEAKKIGRHKTKMEAVTAALNEYIKNQRRMRILELAGSIDFDPKYDYKAERKGKR
jgi:Arc/MetJ family transcription regulator